MVALALLGILALVIGGCACVVWAERGGPRWARGVARVTLAGGELVRRAAKDRRRRERRGLNGSSGGDGD
ncbi:hypothetical protein OHS33_34405 [Streptomyces sp. NBC_00536]|uniref:hypothetical protein n=1 Tax=Streptomyces sp. NBC_00536 TaxID=2975769 RepID=UPI002E80E173|nr:hypothetical protein [Streptomyces sp. NBC_00536]WUC83015.1 hypothetical protein OHS33_34405 [Streptomyces sp. NBC_00536]